MKSHNQASHATASTPRMKATVREKMKLVSDARYVHTYMHENNT